MATTVTIKSDLVVLAGEDALKAKRAKLSNLHSAWLRVKAALEEAQRQNVSHLDGQIARAIAGEPVELAPEALRHKLAAAGDLAAALSGAIRKLDTDVNRARDAVHDARQAARQRLAREAAVKATEIKPSAAQIAEQARYAAFREKMLRASQEAPAT